MTLCDGNRNNSATDKSFHNLLFLESKNKKYKIINPGTEFNILYFNKMVAKCSCNIKHYPIMVKVPFEVLPFTILQMSGHKTVVVLSKSFIDEFKVDDHEVQGQGQL